MAHTMMGSLREVQALDDRIREADEALATFDDRLAAVEKPARALEAQLAKLEKRLAQMRLDERRLERAAGGRGRGDLCRRCVYRRLRRYRHGHRAAPLGPYRGCRDRRAVL